MSETTQSLAFSVVRGALGLLSRTTPNLAGRVAADLFMKPRRFKAPEREREVLAEATPFEVRLGLGGTIRAWRWGSEGPVVVLVHGWEGRGSQLAPFVRPLLGAGYSVVTFDAPGHGASPGKRSSLPHFAWALNAVVEATEPPHAILAHSLGCAAATLALRDGLTTQRLVYISPPLNPVDYTAQFGDMLGLTDAVVDRLRARIEERFARKWTVYSLAETARMMTTPLFVIHDRDDTETRYRGGAKLAELWQGARLMTTERLGHRRILREERVVGAAVEFIATTPAAARTRLG